MILHISIKKNGTFFGTNQRHAQTASEIPGADQPPNMANITRYFGDPK